MLLKGNIRSDIQAERVLSEAQALAEVNHPYIVALHGAFQDETHIFFVLEYVGCGDLYTRLQDGPLADESGRLVLAEVALAIQHVHECGYMYRDLKSENVLLCIDGHIKLADFGLAKKVADKRQEIELRAADGKVRKTRRHSRMIGTFDTMAPEVLGNASWAATTDYGFEVDWWGLGILASEIFTGLEPILVASGETELGREMLKTAYENSSHLDTRVLGTIPPSPRIFIKALLVVDAHRRLGRKGFDEVAAHPYFDGIDFKALLRKELDPPFVAVQATTPQADPKTPPATSPTGPRKLERSERSNSMAMIEDGLIEFLNTPASELCAAAANGDVLRVRNLVSSGTDANSSDYDRRTALHLAASEGLEMVQHLVDEFGADHSPIDRWGGTPLDDAIRSKHAEVVSFLQSRGASHGSGNHVLSDVQAALCDAAAKGDIAQLRLLVTGHDLPVDEGDYDQRTAMHLAASEGMLEVVEYLVDEVGANPSPVDRWGGTPLDDAIRSGHSPIVVYLQAKGAKAGRTNTPALNNTSTELCDAASRGDVERLKQLVRAVGCDINKGDYDKRTAIHLAASEGLLDVVECLAIDLEANLSPLDRWGNTPLDDAIRSRHGSVASFLRSRGGVSGISLRATKDADVHHQESSKPAVAAADLCDAASKGDLHRMRSYILGGHDPNLGDYDKRTAMHLAASEGLLEMVKYLIDEAELIHRPSTAGGTDDAVRHNHFACKTTSCPTVALKAVFRSNDPATTSTACTIL